MKVGHFSLHPQQCYISMIDEASESNLNPTTMLYMYDKVVRDFVAKLTSKEVKAMDNMEVCLGVYPDTVNP